MEKKKYSISVTLPKDLFDELDQMAAGNYTNKSSIVRKAIKEYVDNFRKTGAEEIIKKIEKIEKST